MVAEPLSLAELPADEELLTGGSPAPPPFVLCALFEEELLAGGSPAPPPFVLCVLLEEELLAGGSLDTLLLLLDAALAGTRALIAACRLEAAAFTSCWVAAFARAVRAACNAV